MAVVINPPFVAVSIPRALGMHRTLVAALRDGGCGWYTAVMTLASAACIPQGSDAAENLRLTLAEGLQG